MYRLQKNGLLFLGVILFTILANACKKLPGDWEHTLPVDSLIATKYFVDSTGAGDDLADGLTPQTAWRTLDKVNATTFKPGDYILFKRGCSWTGTLMIKSSGTAGDRVTFGAYGKGEKPHIIGDNSHLAAVMVDNPAYLTIEDFEISHPNSVRPPNLSLCGIYVALSKDGIYPSVTIRNNSIHDVEGMPIFNRHLQAGIFVRSNAAQGYLDSLTIEGNDLRKCASRGIMLGDGSNKDTSFYNNHIVIQNNLVDSTALEGIIVYTAKNVLIDHNKVFNAGAYTLGVDMNIVLAGLWGRGKDMTIQYNEVAYTRLTNPVPYESMDSEAFDIDLGTPGYTIIQYNYSHDNQGGFFLHMGDPGPDFTYGIVRYNISQNDGTQMGNRVFELHSHPNGKTVPIAIYNNTFYNASGIGVLDRNGGTANNPHPGLAFTNNIFFAPTCRFDDTQHILYDHNLYFPGQKAVNDTASLEVDPLLVMAGSGADGFSSLTGYHLKTNSPAMAAGIVIQSNGGIDFFGIKLPNNTPPSIGAAEQ